MFLNIQGTKISIYQVRAQDMGEFECIFVNIEVKCT